MTVFLAAPVIRQVARMELPSTKARTMAARRSSDSWLMAYNLCLSCHGCKANGRRTPDGAAKLRDGLGLVLRRVPALHCRLSGNLLALLRGEFGRPGGAA